MRARTFLAGQPSTPARQEGVGVDKATAPAVGRVADGLIRAPIKKAGILVDMKPPPPPPSLLTYPLNNEPRGQDADAG